MTIHLHRDDLISMVGGFLPMRLMLGKLEKEEDQAWVQVDAFETLTFMPGSGLVVTCAARVHYPLPILPDNFVVEHASLEVVPEVIEGPNGAVLAFRLEVADLDIEYLPAFIDRVVADKINDALHKNATTIAWDFTQSLTRIIPLPARLSLVRAVELGEPQASVEVTSDAIVVCLEVDVSFHHSAAQEEEADEEPEA